MWLTLGQDHILNQISHGLSIDRLAHAYLFTGPPGVGKMCLASDLAKAVNCLEFSSSPCGRCTQCLRITEGIHADVRTVSTFRGSESSARTVIGIDDVKDILHQTNLKPFEGQCIVIIFDGAEQLSVEASNALLKTLEEPSPQVLIILLTDNESNVLETILSRCRICKFKPVAKELIKKTLIEEYLCADNVAEVISRLARGSIGWAINAATKADVLAQRDADLNHLHDAMQSSLYNKFNYANDLASEFSRDRTVVKEVLYLWRGWWRDLLILKTSGERNVINIDKIETLRAQANEIGINDISRFVQIVDETLYALDCNVSPRMALENAMLNMPKTL